MIVHIETPRLIIREPILADAKPLNAAINKSLPELQRWMPWAQRAFCFHIQHTSSQLLLGVLDWDSESGIGKHDSIGRVTIDTTNFRPDTEYLLTYKLYGGILKSEREEEGTITVRLRIE